MSPRTRKVPAAEIAFGALVEDLDQLADDLLALDLLSLLQEQQHAVVGLGRTQAVDAAHRSHDDAVAPLEQRLGCRKPQLIELVVDRRFLLDVDVAGGNVRLGLVIVVIGDEVFDRVVREKRLELVIELGRQRLVVRQDERRTVQVLDDLGHRKRLARAGDAQQHLVLLAIKRAASERLDSGPLIALWLVRADEFKVHVLVASGQCRLSGIETKIVARTYRMRFRRVGIS